MSTALVEVVPANETPVLERHLVVDTPEIKFTPPVQAVLSACFEAYSYARDLDRSLWDFAVEISTLRHMGLSRSDLRWIVGKGFLDCAIETSLPSDAERSFQRPSSLLFCKKTCFVLTQDGAELASKVSARGDSSSQPGVWPLAKAAWQKVAPDPELLVPKWDRDRQLLKIGRAVVKHFKVPATNQEMVLAAFEEEAWPARIDDPLPPRRELLPKKRLRETIKSLNRNQKQSLIRFIGDGSGQGVRWELCGEHQLAC
jgi:hypothetical protein